MPIETIEVKSEDPPELMNGSGRPVTGIIPITTAIFMTACITIIPVIAPASVLPK